MKAEKFIAKGTVIWEVKPLLATATSRKALLETVSQDELLLRSLPFPRHDDDNVSDNKNNNGDLHDLKGKLLKRCGVIKSYCGYLDEFVSSGDDNEDIQALRRQLKRTDDVDADLVLACHIMVKYYRCNKFDFFVTSCCGLFNGYKTNHDDVVDEACLLLHAYCRNIQIPTTKLENLKRTFYAVYYTILSKSTDVSVGSSMVDYTQILVDSNHDHVVRYNRTRKELSSVDENCNEYLGRCEVGQALSLLKKLVPKIFQNDAKPSPCSNYLSGHDLQLHSRQISRLSQANIYDSYMLTVIDEQLLNMNYSCIANCVLEASWDGQEVKLSLVAAFDIMENEELTLTRVSSVMGYKERQDIAIQRTGNPCDCFYCKFEKQKDDGKSFNLTSKKTYYQLGNISMQRGDFSEAILFYQKALTSSDDPKDEENAHIFHGLATAHLECGYVLKAHSIWENAAKSFPNFDLVSREAEKIKAFRFSAKCVQNSSSINSLPHLNNKCFLTTTRVLTIEECGNLIKFSEAHAKQEGWMTSRHYAVPTTDLPINIIPEALRMFNDIFYNRLRPLFGKQFGEHELGVNGSKLFIHDAFIVKYDATKQRHLPLHKDQSTYSFTVSLNPLSDYEGGGTYISKLGYALRSDIGHVLSFRGDQIEHGGDVVISGTRYIIAAFCYADKSDTKNNRLSNYFSASGGSKRMKMDSGNTEIMKKEEDTSHNLSSFSFGFHF